MLPLLTITVNMRGFKIKQRAE
uniref:Uncharacterized protein n=1 Tax=Triticum urartu TaxID=4572 RepID=A0A8R7TJG9_TRIUA